MATEHAEGRAPAEWPGQALEEETVVVEPTNGAAPRNVLETLQKRREAVAAEKTMVSEIPGWFGCLGLRLGPISSRALERIAERATSSKSPEKSFNGNADTLINACVEVVGRQSVDDEWEAQLDEEGEPYRIDVRLAAKLGLRVEDRARAVVRALYSSAPSVEMAVGKAATEYVEWAAAANEEADEEFVGES